MEQGSGAAQGRLKKRIILAFGLVVLLILLAYGILAALEGAFNHREKEDYHSSYIFYEPNYEEDIYADEGYLELNRYISLSDGVTTSILTEEEYTTEGDDVALLVTYLQSIISGDDDMYNACFSEAYYAENEAHDRFTPQKLYNITLTKKETQTEEDGSTLYGYTVEYMIRHNNGTFRRDLGSDSIRTQYVVLSDREGEVKIDRVITYSYQ